MVNKKLIIIIILITFTLLLHQYTTFFTRKIIVPQYNSSTNNKPIQLGNVNSQNAYIFLKMKFMATDTKGWPNLLQTGPLNDGLRIELSGNKLTLIFRTLWSNRGNPGFKAFELDPDFTLNEWHELTIEVRNGKYLCIELDGKEFKYEGIDIDIDTSNILVGGGFIDLRAFKGEIVDAHIIKRN